MQKQLIILLLAILPCLLSAQNCDSISTERFDFATLGKENGIIIERADGWRVFIRRATVDRLEYREYPPDSSYYCIIKKFYRDGTLKEEGKMIPPVLKIEIWKYYDENGCLVRTVDENARFGKVTPNDVLKLAIRLKKFADRNPYYYLITKDPDGYMDEVPAGATIGYDEDRGIWELRLFNRMRRATFVIDGDTGSIHYYTIDYMDGRGISYKSDMEDSNIFEMTKDIDLNNKEQINGK